MWPGQVIKSTKVLPESPVFLLASFLRYIYFVSGSMFFLYANTSFFGVETFQTYPNLLG